MHGLVSGFKALTTWDGEKYSEIIKQACGGHGFTDWSGIHRIHSDFGFGWQMTEGDNTVMAQQASKYLLLKLKNGEINIAEQEFDISSGKLDMDQELLFLLEMRYKGELMKAAKLL